MHEPSKAVFSFSPYPYIQAVHYAVCTPSSTSITYPILLSNGTHFKLCIGKPSDPAPPQIHPQMFDSAIMQLTQQLKAGDGQPAAGEKT